MADSVSISTDRRTQLLDAAIRLLGTGGMRAVTHRAVEAEAGVPHGSTTYWFKTRDQLIEAAVERMVETDRERAAPIGQAVTHALAQRDGPPDMTAVADAIVDWIESDRTIQLARYEVSVAGGRNPRLRQIMSEASRHFWRLAEPIAIAMGSDDPKRDARVLTALLDGLQFDYLTRDPADAEVFRAGVQRLLTGAFER